MVQVDFPPPKLSYSLTILTSFHYTPPQSHDLLPAIFPSLQQEQRCPALPETKQTKRSPCRLPAYQLSLSPFSLLPPYLQPPTLLFSITQPASNWGRDSLVLLKTTLSTESPTPIWGGDSMLFQRPSRLGEVQVSCLPTKLPDSQYLCTSSSPVLCPASCNSPSSNWN